MEMDNLHARCLIAVKDCDSIKEAHGGSEIGSEAHRAVAARAVASDIDVIDKGPVLDAHGFRYKASLSQH